MDITSPVSTPAATPAATTPININSGPSSAPLPPKPSTTLPDQNISLDFDGEDSTSFDTNKAPEKPVEDTAAETTNETTAEETDPFDLPKDVSEAIKATKPKETAQPEAPKPDAQNQATTQQGRDYSNLPDEVVSVLKKLPNQTYNAVREQLPKWYDAFKKQADIPKYFTQHPEAYKLDTGYNQVQNELETDRFEVGALKDALIAVKQNKPFDLLTGYDAEGNPVFKTVNPDRNGHNPSVELELTEAYRRAQGNYEKSFQGFKSYPDRFKAKIAEEREFINSSFKKIFKDIDPDKLSPEEKNYAPLLEKIIPDSVTAEDARKIAHYAMVGNLRMAKAFQNYIAQQKQKPIAAPAPQAGPIGKSVGGDDIPLSDGGMFGDD
tara:strand:- start:226 stop:1365 length:1140 start_codon:yes stop_codon:yes gene_type:complete